MCQTVGTYYPSQNIEVSSIELLQSCALVQVRLQLRGGRARHGVPYMHFMYSAFVFMPTVTCGAASGYLRHHHHRLSAIYPFRLTVPRRGAAASKKKSELQSSMHATSWLCHATCVRPFFASLPESLVDTSPLLFLFNPLPPRHNNPSISSP